MKKLLYGGWLFIGIFIFFGLANAQESTFDVEFPIPELGSCASMEECAVYCDDAAHGDACYAWARDNGFIQEERRALPPPAEDGPGGCRGDACREYCDNLENRNECIDYAVSHGHMNAEEGEKIKRLNEGGPGGCKNQEECRTFCENPENQTACIDFAEKEGFMTPEQAAQARKFANKKGPGGCSNREECDRFCNQEENQETCIRYAVDEGMMSPEQAERILSLMEEGGHYRDEFEVHDIGPKEPKIDKEKAMRIVEEEGGPGGCGTFEECEAFCSDPANGETCMNFALEHGLIPPEEAERMRHIMSVEGPGGCRGRECEEYCEAPGRERECIEFASREGLVTPEEAEKIKKFIDATEAGGPGGCIGRECETYCNAPEHRDECFEFAKKQGLFPEEHLRRMEEMMKMER
ncbi:hypothetical protein L0Y46_00015, partial [bacterium]|nr:hypothetical protein [bacterium]